MVLRRLTLFVTLAAAGCGGSRSVADATETITGGERFGWDQPAADAGELAAFRYAVYVDDARSEAADVACTPAPSSGRFPCTSALPAMPSGAHTLQIAAFVIDGGIIRESARSAAVRVMTR
jgi:hypothetical protein